jgi:hypothetical protein
MTGVVQDTPPEVERVQVELSRKRSVAERVALVRSFSKTIMALSRRAIARANPELSDLDADL